MESPLEGNLKENSIEEKEERMEALEGIVTDFDKNIEPLMAEYLNVARFVFQEEKGYDDDLKRNSFVKLTTALGSFRENLASMHKLFEREDPAVVGINLIYNQVQILIERLQAAPDARYTKEKQIEKFGGDEKNIPAAKTLDIWEKTEEAFGNLNYYMGGIAGALSFINKKRSW